MTPAQESIYEKKMERICQIHTRIKSRVTIGNLKSSEEDILREVVFDQLAMMQVQFHELCDMVQEIGAQLNVKLKMKCLPE